MKYRQAKKIRDQIYLVDNSYDRYRQLTRIRMMQRFQKLARLKIRKADGK